MTPFLKSVCQRYHLGVLKRWSKIPKGLINTKILLKTTRGNFVLRVSSRPKEQLAYEVALLRHLKSLPVPQLISFSNDKYISECQEKYYIVYQYIAGQMPNKITPALLTQLGRFQALFHQKGKNFRRHVSREPYTYNFPPAKLRAFHRYLAPRIPQQFKEPYRVVYQTLCNITPPPSLPSGPIHVDIKPENVLVHQGKLAGVLDFDNGYQGPYIIDLGKTITWFCIQRGKLDQRKLKTFLGAYRRIRSLTPREQKFLNQAILHAVASHIFIDYHRYLKGIIPLSYLKMLHREFYPILEK